MGKNRNRRYQEALTVFSTYMDQHYPGWREDRYAVRRVKAAAKKAARNNKNVDSSSGRV